MNRNEAWDAANQKLGYVGAMISASKSGHKAKGDKPVVFNANICTKEHGKIWYGDLDVNRSISYLQGLAKEMGVTIYVLREMDARFQNEAKPLFENAVFTITPE